MKNILNKLFHKKEYLSCEWLERGIHFSHEGIEHCPMYAHREKDFDVVSPITSDNKYDFDDFFKKKLTAKKMHKAGKLSPFCEGCFLLENKVWDNKFKITKMAISTNTRCNCNCIYCYTHEDKEKYNSKPDIPIYDYIKKLVKTHKISKDCQIEFGGGEPVICSEFEDLMKLFIDNNFKNIKIHSSGIKYSEGIEQALKKDICNLIISPDAGTDEIYKKIKNTDAFNDVWNNIKKYTDAQNKLKNMVKIKYIILFGINDSRELIDKFFNKIEESNVKHVLIDADMSWYQGNKDDKEKIEKLFKILKYMENYAKKIGIEYGHNSVICCAISKYHQLYDSTSTD